ncbi:MAG: DUF4294 domain-containing protein [Muribaculaceae bacterium]
MCAASVMRAQESVAAMPEPGQERVQYIKGYNWRVDADGDSTIVYYMTDLYVYPKLKFRNDKERQEYSRLVRNVKITLPYAKLIAETLIETYEYIESFSTQKERDDYIKLMEKEIFKQYKPVLKHFSKTQARLLVKLIQRQTHQSSYNILKAFLGTFRASFWQGFGRLFGVNLKSGYNPEKDKDDFLIERVASQVELGLL